MKIYWLGTASLLIESDGHKILFDPYLRSYNKNLPSFPLDKINEVEAIFITHPHLDHYADLPTVLRYTNCPVYTNGRGLELIEKMNVGKSCIERIELGDVFAYGNLTIKAYRGRHVEFDKACIRGAVLRTLKGHLIKGLKLNNLNNRMSINNTNDVFAFYVQEGDKSALIMGSANIDEQTEYPKPDLLIYPYQGRSNMLEYSMKQVQFFSPKIVLTDHFDDAFPPLSTRMNVEEFKTKIESESSIKVIIPTENKGIVF